MLANPDRTSDNAPTMLHRIHLYMVFAWLAFAGVLFQRHFQNPEQAPRLPVLGLPMAWLPVMMAAYSLLRWLGGRRVARRREAEREERRRAATQRPVRELEYHPELDFNRPTPPE